MDKYTEINRTSGLNNIGNSFKGILFGIILILGSIYLLWTNEGRAVHVAQALEEGSGNVKSISSEKIDAANEGKLVHTTALATTKDTLKDSDFDIKANALKLIREVEIYQWVEKTDSKSTNKLGGGTETTTEYTYVKEWTNSAIKSDKYKVLEGHVNVAPYSYSDETKISTNVNFGAFELNEELVQMISGAENISVQSIDTSKLKNSVVNAGNIYLGSKNISNPEIGDLKISFSAVYPKKVSIVAKQIGNTFEEYLASNGETVLLLKNGVSSAENMFAKAIEGNNFKTWLFRLLGFLLMFFGFRTIFKPLVAIGNVIPFVGSMISMGTGIISFALALPITFVIIAIAWFAYRPILSGSLIGIGLLIYFFYRSRGKKSTGGQVKVPNNNGGNYTSSGSKVISGGGSKPDSGK